MIGPIWLYWGNDRMSFLRYMTIHSACVLNPGQVRLVIPDSPTLGLGIRSWGERQDMQYYDGPDYSSGVHRLRDTHGLSIIPISDIAPNIAEIGAPEVHTKDLLTWWLLGKYGGTCADMDIVFVKPVPEIHAQVQLVVFDGHPKPGYMPVSFLQGLPNEWWHKIYRDALRQYDPMVYESCGAGLLEKCGLPADWARLSSQVVYPFAEGEVLWMDWHKMIFAETHELPEECVGVHWYAGRNGRYNLKITERNWWRWGTLSEAIRTTWPEDVPLVAFEGEY